MRRSANSLSKTPLKFVVYGVLPVFISLTFLSLLKNKFSDNNIPSLNHLQRIDKKCNVSEHKRQLIRNLEPLISQEPLDMWEGLGDEEKNIRYLPSMTDLAHKDRIIYVDVGARDYESSIGDWFLKKYPKQGKRFDIYAVEADKAFHEQYASIDGVNLLPYAAWVRNETVVFGSKPIIVEDKVWMLRPCGRIEGQEAEEDPLSAVVRVEAFDFVEWLERTVKESDFQWW